MISSWPSYIPQWKVIDEGMEAKKMICCHYGLLLASPKGFVSKTLIHLDSLGGSKYDLYESIVIS